MPSTNPEIVIVPRSSDIGGFEVRRALPSAQRRTVGPFVFFDQMGPEILRPGHGLDVAPHPHIGLATVTYLFDGELLHRDSLGTVQAIQPGAVNWMTAGGGIVHSERTPPELRGNDSLLFGIQAWVALPERHEEMAPDFAHHAADTLPLIDGDGVRARLIAGQLFGKTSPVRTLSDMIYADVELAERARFDVPADYPERAVYLTDGAITLDGGRYEAGQLLVLRPDRTVTLAADGPARLMLLGGEPLDGPRHIWWNFVASSRERIERAKADWQGGRFAPVPGETEFIPLPEPRRAQVKYP